jgi:hypothetical protein
MERVRNILRTLLWLWSDNQMSVHNWRNENCHKYHILEISEYG